MEGITLEELQQRKAEIGAQVIAAEMNYTLQRKRAEDSRDQWVGLVSVEKTLDSLIRSIQSRIDNKSPEVDNVKGATEEKEKGNGDA